MDNRDLISIIIPIYNVENYLEKCLDSVIKQTYDNIEIILIDDGSEDKSKQICDNYVKLDSRIKVIHKNNEGVSKARNIGIDMSKGKFITFVDSDDYIDINYIEVLYELAIKNKSDIVICGVKDEDNDGNIVNISNEIITELNKKEILKELLNEKYFFSVCWAKLYKRDRIGDIRFNENMKIAEDLEFLYKLLDNINAVYVDTTKKLYHFLIREGSATRKGFNENWKKEIELCENIINDVSKRYPDIRDYAIKRYFKVVMTCMIIELKTSNNKDTVNYLKNKLIEFKKQIRYNYLIGRKQKIFFYTVLINPFILKCIFGVKKKLRRIQ